MTDHTVLICGGRDYADRSGLYTALDGLVPRPTHVITGAAPGADTLASEWACDRGITPRAFYADWEMYGSRAGPMRNQQMLDEGKPDLVMAFPGGRGTADMVRRAKAAGVRVLEVK